MLIRKFLRFIGFWVLFSVSFNIHARSNLFGQFVGVLEHSKVEKDQFAKLDFIVSQEQGDNLKLMAVLSVYFGDFSSKEYVSYHFDGVRYNLVTGELVFDQADQDVTILTTNFSEGNFEAVVRSTVAGDVGRLILVKGGTASPSREIIGPLWGEYESTCESEVQTLQLQSFRSEADAVRVGNPFGSYEIRGQLASYNQALCPNEFGKSCVKNNIYAGAYNFYQDQLTLSGEQGRMTCTTVDVNTINCGSCAFRRTSSETSSFSQITPKTSKNMLIGSEKNELDGSATGLSGTYTGYLHHEYLDQYQEGAINIIAFQDPSGSGLQMSATANLNFGSMSSGESISYRFDQRPYNLLSKQFVFEGASADVDAVLQINYFKEGVIRGTWYSILFGRVGTFEFSKESMAKLPEDLKPFKGIAGFYESDAIELKVAVRMGAGPASTENPFFPLTFGGSLYYKAGFARRIDITGGSYDFYTGRLGFILRDGARVASGLNMSDKKQIKLKFGANGFGRLMQSHDLITYYLVE